MIEWILMIVIAVAVVANPMAPVGLLYRVCVKWFPELAFYATERKRRDAFKQALKDSARTLLTMIVAASIVFGGLAALYGIIVLVYPLVGLPSSVFAIAPIGCLGSLLLGVVQVWFFRHRIQLSMRRKLVRSGVLVCMQCGYDLRGSKERCPECGEAFESPELKADR